MNKLVINVGLAFVAGFVTTFGAFTAVTPKPPGTAAVIAAVAASAWAGFRAVAGLLSAKYGNGVSVDR